MNKKISYTITTILIMIMIFMFSAQNAVSSDGVSFSLTYRIMDIFVDFDNMTAEETYQFIFSVNGYIRALAHFVSFFMLGFSFCRMLMEYKVKRQFFYTLLFCLLYAVSDELHQMLFSVGRAGEVIDVIKDFAGSLSAVILIKIAGKWG